MTRKKWLRLRRRRPDLFKGLDLPPWEKHSRGERLLLMKQSQSSTVAALTAYQLGKDF